MVQPVKMVYLKKWSNRLKWSNKVKPLNMINCDDRFFALNGICGERNNKGGK